MSLTWKSSGNQPWGSMLLIGPQFGLHYAMHGHRRSGGYAAGSARWRQLQGVFTILSRMPGVSPKSEVRSPKVEGQKERQPGFECLLRKNRVARESWPVQGVYPKRRESPFGFRVSTFFRISTFGLRIYSCSTPSRTAKNLIRSRPAPGSGSSWGNHPSIGMSDYSYKSRLTFRAAWRKRIS